jgi:hypothetical protein
MDGDSGERGDDAVVATAMNGPDADCVAEPCQANPSAQGMLSKALVLCTVPISCAPITLLAIRLGLLPPAYSGLRCLFLVFNWRQLAEASRSDLFYAMVKGLRFDLSPSFC